MRLLAQGRDDLLPLLTQAATQQDAPALTHQPINQQRRLEEANQLLQQYQAAPGGTSEAAAGTSSQEPAGSVNLGNGQAAESSREAETGEQQAHHPAQQGSITGGQNR